MSFGRTETWSSGWRGKQSSTAIRLDDGSAVGEILGEESAATPRAMTYTIHGVPGLLNHRSDSLKEAKEKVSQILRKDVEK